MSNSKQILVGWIMAIGLGACATSGIEGTGNPMSTDEIARHVVIQNESLAADVMITQMLARQRGDLLQVSVELSNQTSSNKQIQYMFSWYDADQFEVEQGSRGWTPVTLHGHASIHMQAVAPTPNVKTYKITVREW